MDNIKKVFEIPKEYFGNFKLEYTKNKIICYNYKTIINITNNLIDLNNCLIHGNNLRITELKKDYMLINGIINKVEFKK